MYLSPMAEIVVYKKNPCPFCDRAINLLNGKDLKYQVVDLTGKEDEILKLKEKWGWQTVPIIVINGKLVGGYTDLRALDDSGELDKMVKS
jgi:glutaredoxin 3